VYWSPAVLIVTNVQFADAGHYAVVVSNLAGAVASAEAALTVLPAPVHPGAFDPSFRVSVEAWTSIEAIAQQVDGKLVIGGNFSSVNGVPCDGLARLYPDGTLDTSFHPSLEPSGVSAMALQTDGKLLIGGDVRSVNGVVCHGLARLHSDGRLDESFAPASNSVPSVMALAVQPDGKVLAAVHHSAVSQATSHLARLLADGSVDGSFSAQAGESHDGLIHAIAVQPDGKILMAGSFLTINGLPRRGIARLHPDGSLDLSFNPGSGAEVQNLVLQPDGRIVVVGAFNQFNGVPRGGVARLNADGSLDLGFDTDLVEGGPFSVALQSDGRILVGGSFTSVAGLARNGIARLNSDGTLDRGFDPRGGVQPITDGCVRAIVVQADGKIVIAGSDFLSFDDFPCHRICRLFGDLGPSAPTISVQPDSQIIPAGSTATFSVNATGTLPLFYQWLFNGNTILAATNQVLTLDHVQFPQAGQYAVVVSNVVGSVTGYAMLIVESARPGNLDASFKPALAGRGARPVLATESGGRLYVAQALVGTGSPRNELVRLHQDGSLDTWFRPSIQKRLLFMAVWS
jgi:uncharacterized delta-60 repeat protein